MLLITCLLYAGIVISDLYSSKKALAEARLREHLNSVTLELDDVFFHAEQNVKTLVEVTPTLVKLPPEVFFKSGRDIAGRLLSAYEIQYDAYWGFTKEFSNKYFNTPGMVYTVEKRSEYVGTKKFNDLETFVTKRYPSDAYQNNPKEIWYHQTQDKKNIQYTPFYRDQTYTQKVMISLTQAIYDKTGKSLGIAGIDITPEAFSKRYRELKIGNTGGIIVVDENGQAILPLLVQDSSILGYKIPKNLNDETLLNKQLEERRPFPLSSKTTEYQGHDGENYIVIASALKMRPWYIIAYQNKKEAFNEPLFHTLITILMGACVFLILYCVTHILGKTITRSVSHLIENMDTNANEIKFLDHNKRLTPIQPEGPREFRRLAEQLNGIYLKLEDTVSDLTQALIKAEKATEAKTRFLSVMSHEIRTPLNSMLGLTDVLLLTKHSNEQNRYLTTLQKAGKSLLRILNDILDFSRLETNNLMIESHEFDLFDLIQSIEQLMRFNAESKGLQFKVHLNTPHYILSGDSVRLQQVLLNLIGNAIKFTPSGRIDIHVDQIKNKFRFSIVDTGIGISDEQKDKIFTHFSQGDASISRRFGGTGLGLSISKYIVELMGGTIQVKSSQNHGSNFYFEVNLEIRRIKETNLNNDLQFQKPTTKDLTTHIAEKQKIKILVVDDDEDNHNLLTAYLKFRTDIEIIHAENGQQALELYTYQKIDLILMDIQMPDMDGLETIQMIRKINKPETNHPVPIIVISANTFPEDREQSLKHGAQDHVGKPIQLEIFNALIQKWT